MKYLIINADDFGNNKAVNRGIVEGIQTGVITSTSLMVKRKYAQEIEQLLSYLAISIGLHFELPSDGNELDGELYQQIDIFEKLVGRKPDHIDAHKVRPKDIEGLSVTLATYSQENHTPIRDWGHAYLIDDFFGLELEGTGSLDLNKISPAALIETLKEQLRDGYNELMCHAGHVDEELRLGSSYSDPRETELHTLLSTQFRTYLEQNLDIRLISWKDVKI